MEYLQNSMYKDQLPSAVYFPELANRGEELKGAHHSQAGRFGC